MARLLTSQVLVASQTYSPPIVIVPPAQSGPFSQGWLAPGILAFVSSGGSLTYNVEVTGDDTQLQSYNAALGNWQPFTGMSGLTANATATLGAAVRAMRLNCTAYVSGSVLLQIVQVSPYGAD
jgi:hypothetical protein